MLNFGEVPRYQPIDTVDPFGMSQTIDVLFTDLYNICYALGFEVKHHANYCFHTREHTVDKAVLLGRLTTLQHDLFRLVHLLGMGRYSAAAFTEFYNSRLTLVHDDGKVHHDANNRPIPPESYLSPDYRTILDFHNPRPLFADHVNTPVQTDDGSTFTD